MDESNREWTALDDEQVKMESMGFHHPLTTAFAFVNALADLDENREYLGQLVTPESRVHWGDFTGAAALLESIPKPGFGSIVNRRPGSPDVGYFKILSNVSDSYEVSEEKEIRVPAVITLVWRQEAGEGALEQPGMWLVHQIGPHAEPHELGHVRTSTSGVPDF